MSDSSADLSVSLDSKKIFQNENELIVLMLKKTFLKE
jgi:hypothetical protein